MWRGEDFRLVLSLSRRAGPIVRLRNPIETRSMWWARCFADAMVSTPSLHVLGYVLTAVVSFEV